MLLCRCEESLLFRNAREVYVYQRGEPMWVRPSAFSRLLQPAGESLRRDDAAAAIFFFSLAVSLRESRAKTTGTKRKTTPEGWFLVDLKGFTPPGHKPRIPRPTAKIKPPLRVVYFWWSPRDGTRTPKIIVLRDYVVLRIAV